MARNKSVSPFIFFSGFSTKVGVRIRWLPWGTHTVSPSVDRPARRARGENCFEAPIPHRDAIKECIRNECQWLRLVKTTGTLIYTLTDTLKLARKCKGTPVLIITSRKVFCYSSISSQENITSPSFQRKRCELFFRSTTVQTMRNWLENARTFMG